MARTQTNDNNNDEPTTDITATSDKEQEYTHDETPAEEEDVNLVTEDKESSHGETYEHDDNTSTKLAGTARTTTDIATAASITKMSAKKKVKLDKYKQASRMRKL